MTHCLTDSLPSRRENCMTTSTVLLEEKAREITTPKGPVRWPHLTFNWVAGSLLTSPSRVTDTRASGHFVSERACRHIISVSNLIKHEKEMTGGPCHTRSDYQQPEASSTETRWMHALLHWGRQCSWQQAPRHGEPRSLSLRYNKKKEKKSGEGGARNFVHEGSDEGRMQERT